MKTLLGFLACCLPIVLSGVAQEQKYSREEWLLLMKQFQTSYAAAKDTPARVSAIKMFELDLGRAADPQWETDAVNILFDIATSGKEEAVTDAALDAIMRLSNPTAMSVIAKRTGAPAAVPLKLKFVRLFDRMRHEEFTEALASFLNDANPDVVAAALNGLARLSNHQALEAVVRFMKSANPKVKAAALESIKKSGDPRFMAPLILLIKNDKDEGSRQAALELLKSITGEDFGLDAAQWSEWLKKNEKNPLSKVNQTAVDAAIEKGVKWLKSRNTIPGGSAELTAYTYIHAGLPLEDEAMKAAIAYLETAPITTTYRAALIAMALHDLDKLKYRKRIAECAYFLMGNQDPKGYWRYGEPVDGFEPPPIDSVQDKSIETPGGKQYPPKKDGTGVGKVPEKIKIKVPSRRPLKNWDNSNSQYAVLGLRACADTGILIPTEVWRDAEKHFAGTQNSDGGWHYVSGPSYGSMTSGGISSIAICKYYQGKAWKDAAEVTRGTAWLGKNFSVVQNPHHKQAKRFHYYYLYGLERAGILAETEYFGTYEWYPIGANFLLANQDAEGGWNHNAIDTCFAILFLRRATGNKPQLKPKEKLIDSTRDKQDPPRIDDK